MYIRVGRVKIMKSLLTQIKTQGHSYLYLLYKTLIFRPFGHDDLIALVGEIAVLILLLFINKLIK